MSGTRQFSSSKLLPYVILLALPKKEGKPKLKPITPQKVKKLTLANGWLLGQLTISY